MSRRVKIAIDGCGALTTYAILPHLAQSDFQAKAEVVAVCDIVPERAAAAAQAYGIPRHFTDYATMLDESSAEAVLVVVPATVHAEHAILAARHGLHIYLQKPMATSTAEARAVLDEVRQQGVRLVAAPGQVLWPLYGQIRALIEQGAIGKPYLAQAPMLGWGSETLEFPTHPGWFFRENSGPLRDHGGYSLHTLTAILGPVRRVAAFAGTGWPQRTWQGETFPVTGPDNFAALLDFGENLFGLLPEAWCHSSPAASVLRILGLEGSIEGDLASVNDTHLFPYGCTVYPVRGEPYRVEVERESLPFLAGKHPEIENTHVYADILHLVDCIREGREPLAGGEQALHTVEVIEAILRAINTGQAQEI